jgi:chorismate mutase
LVGVLALARLRAAGRVLSNILTRDSARNRLAEAIAEAKAEARGRGITDADVEEELARWGAGLPG